MKNDLERRIERLEARMETALSGPTVVILRYNDEREPTAAVAGDRVLAEREPAESLDAFMERLDGLLAPTTNGVRVFLPDNNRR